MPVCSGNAIKMNNATNNNKCRATIDEYSLRNASPVVATIPRGINFRLTGFLLMRPSL